MFELEEDAVVLGDDFWASLPLADADFEDESGFLAVLGGVVLSPKNEPTSATSVTHTAVMKPTSVATAFLKGLVIPP